MFLVNETGFQFHLYVQVNFYQKLLFLHQLTHKMTTDCSLNYSHLSNNRGGWNKRGGSAKVAKSITVEVGINVEGGIYWKKLVHKCNKREVEGGKI